MMAASLSSGSVAAFNLGNKFVLFVTGVVGTGIATVMLPHFSSFIARSNLLDARRELSFFLFLTTVLSIPLSILFYLVSEQFVRTAFLGNAFSNNDVRVVAKVVEFGIIQLPFFSCNMLLLKFATANRNVNWIMITSMLGLFMNVIMNFLFMKYIGVAGISLASTLSLMIATILFIIVIHKSGDIYWVDIAMITLNWMLFLTVILCFHYHSFSGVIISLLALLFISLGHLKVFFRFSGA
jgi:putative peptidoglycan lipid II flippase